jgi:flagellar FliJ protein
MIRSKRMQPVVNVTANREREAAQRLGEGQQRVQAAEQRLEDLIHYREEYTQQFASGGSLNTARLQDYRIFLDRLNQAVDQQHQQVTLARQECAGLRQRWMALHTRAQALDKVVERYRGEERSDQEKRDQKESDQHAHTLREHKKSRDE